MLYSITRPFAKIALGIYFRKIYIANLEAIPKDKPVILAANHPTAFIEPCILACWLDKPLSFIARGDLYVNNRFLKKLYDWYHMTPIFRQEDTGYSNLKSNYETFEKCYETLSNKIPLMILVEGRTLHEKRLRPMRKGTARIVFGAQEKHSDLDIHIVPVGINYTNPDNFRSIAMIEFGDPIRCSDYIEVFDKNPAKAVNQLTKEMGKRLLDKVIHIKNEENDGLVEKLLTLQENEMPESFFPVSSRNNSLFISQKSIANTINDLGEKEKQDLIIKVSNYFEKLKVYDISDFGLMHTHFYTFKNTLFAVIGFIPAMIGYILNILPVFIGNTIAKKIAPSIEFRAATAIVFSSFLYLFYDAILFAIGCLLGCGWWNFLLVLIPILGYYYLIYSSITTKWSAGKKVVSSGNERINSLLKERSDLKFKLDFSQ